VSGCNYGAKNTILMNYLLDAWRHDAQIYTGAEVRSLTKNGDLWQVVVGDRALMAKTVILAAGTLGTTEILLRSRSDNLRFSEQLGQRFSGNGDVWAFGYNASMLDGEDRLPVYGVGAGDRDVDAETEGRYLPGPCITGMIDLRDRTERLEDGLIIEEGVMPGALAAGYAAMLPMMDALMGDPFRFGDVATRLQDAADVGEDITKDPTQLGETAYTGPVSRTLPFLVMSHDASDGVLRMNGDNVVVDWPNAGLDPAIVGDATVLRKGSDAIKAEFMPLPFWQNAFGNRVMSVHPIGGCGMGDTVFDGVINERCQVFDPDGDIYTGLYVCDGAALTGGIGVNPHLTITALAERAVELLAEDHGWVIDWGDLEPLPKDETAIGERDPLKDLAMLIASLKSCRSAIENDNPGVAVFLLGKIWNKVVEIYEGMIDPDVNPGFPIIATADFIKLVDNKIVLEQAIGPAVDQCLEVLEDLEIALKAGGGAKVLSVFEDHMGDFSPPAMLPEVMVGRISAVGLHDDPQPTDPYRVAASVSEECTLKTVMETDAIRTTITPPDGIADITSGTFDAPILGGKFDVVGTFQFLMPNSAKVECWEMRYAGSLTPNDHVGPALTFHGIKTLQRRDGSLWWTDLTEINLDVFDEGVVVARGVLRVGFEEALRQATSVQIGFEADALLFAFKEAYAALQLNSDTILGLKNILADRTLRANLIKGCAHWQDEIAQNHAAQTALESLSQRQVVGRFVGLVLRCYGDIFAYMMNFPANNAGEEIATSGLPEPTIFKPQVGDGLHVKLTRYKGGTCGPVMLAGGFGTKASSFALSTVDTNLVQMLCDADYDVWLFDYRGSGGIAQAVNRSPSTILRKLIGPPQSVACWIIPPITSKTSRSSPIALARCRFSWRCYLVKPASGL
jgi:hypothetical protein